MFNFYFNANYWLEGKKLIGKPLLNSKLLNSYKRNKFNNSLPINDNLVYSGPEKLVNNFLKMFSNNQLDVSINNKKFINNYFIQYDTNVKKIFKSIYSKNENYIIGPLYDLNNLHEIINLSLNKNNVKIVVASYENITNFKKLNNKLDDKNFVVLPGPVLNNNFEIKPKKYDFIVYFKNRNYEELKKITNFLDKKKFKYVILKYGEYNPLKFKNAVSSSKAAIVIAGTESQGFAIQEMMISNLPLFVFDYKINKYANYNFIGTTVPYWSDECGEKVENFEDFEKKIMNFFNNLEKYNPYKLVSRELSPSVIYKKILSIYI